MVEVWNVYNIKGRHKTSGSSEIPGMNSHKNLTLKGQNITQPPSSGNLPFI